MIISKPQAFYNENDPFAAEWLRQLIKTGQIASGYVDERSIEDIHPSDLSEFTQCHFFAGIGVWSYALRQIGWNDDQPIWSGSCPCQPFSTAGNGEGFDDKRHLWPAWFWLIIQSNPATIVGEQVSSKLGWTWFDLVSTDLEMAGYAVGSLGLASASIGSPNERERIFWLADTERARLERQERAFRPVHHSNRQTSSCGSNVQFYTGRDGIARPIKSGIQPLAYEPTAVVGRLRGYGNAINAEVAATFLESALA